MKITVVGGGSSYTPELIEGLIARHASLPITELALVDVEAGRRKVEIISALARRMLDRNGLEAVKVSVHFDADRAIAGSSFVLTQLRVGQLPARAADERLGLSHKLLGQETTGVGGFAKALRTIPVMLDIARRVERLDHQLYQSGRHRHGSRFPLQQGENHRPVQRAGDHAPYDSRYVKTPP
jgi:6-phospho-beta-glucosidase